MVFGLLGLCGKLLGRERAVVRYIDANAVRAGIVVTSAEHEFGSARSYIVGPRPIWLSSEWVAQRAMEPAVKRHIRAGLEVRLEECRNVHRLNGPVDL